MRVGFGYDVHPIVKDRRMIIGGVDVPYEFGLGGHSDADVLLHAIGDAMLGAAALGDLGKHFPDTDPTYADVSSLLLLRNINKSIQKKGFNVINVDAMVVLERPKLAPYIEKMRENIAECLNAEVNQISVKATTSEKMGFIGRGDGIASHAVVLISNI